MRRREFLRRAGALGALSGLGVTGRSWAEPPPETTRIRFCQSASACFAPQNMAEEFLRLEGFTEVEYVDRRGAAVPETLLQDRADMSMVTAPETLPLVDAGQPLVVLAGVHAGCWELFGTHDVRAIRDLKGRSIAIRSFGSTEHVFISSMLAYVGIAPRTDIHWVLGKTIPATMELFETGRADAFLAFPPQPQQLRARKVGWVLVNTTHDRPWSQYFCCMLAAHGDFVRRYPVATKRAVRAVLKAADLCAREPQRVAQQLVHTRVESGYQLTLEVLSDIRYDRWRDAHPEDTLRFHALRLHEAGMVRSDPQKLIARGTDWRFLDELKRELKV
jgi:NitT/TauT family transport system substrate-binding protein